MSACPGWQSLLQAGHPSPSTPERQQTRLFSAPVLKGLALGSQQDSVWLAHELCSAFLLLGHRTARAGNKGAE